MLLLFYSETYNVEMFAYPVLNIVYLPLLLLVEISERSQRRQASPLTCGYSEDF